MRRKLKKKKKTAKSLNEWFTGECLNEGHMKYIFRVKPECLSP